MSVAAKKHSGLKRKFTVQAAPGSEVYLAGCFTGWREREIPLKDDGNGNFEAEVELEPGGNWMLDLDNSDITVNGRGTLNNVLKVEETEN